MDIGARVRSPLGEIGTVTSWNADYNTSTVRWDDGTQSQRLPVVTLTRVPTFGFELEVSDGADNTLAHLLDFGLTQHTRYHAYHCDCSQCAVTTEGWLFKAQQDCTADGELITRVLEYGSPDADRTIAGISRALLMAGARTDGDVGNHVHVSHAGMDVLAKVRLARLFARYEPELEEIAAAGHARKRTYNGSRPTYRPELWTARRDDASAASYQYMDGSNLEWKWPTVEFRLWNSTRAAWRIRTHVGLSVAMVLAATDGVECEQHDPRCLEDTIGDYIDAPTWAGILRQRFSKGGAAEIAA